MTGKINFLSVIFYYGGIMKRFLSILMCIFILTISVITYFPFSVKAADNDFTLSNEGINLSSGEANNAVKNKGDIYTADHLILFRYTPTSDYNWTYVNQNIHLSDAQVVALLMSDNKYEVIAKLAGSAASHSVITRGMLAALGVLTTGDSDIFNSFFDMLTSNYNYLNAIEYDPQTGDLTLLADQVTALREDLKKQYYNSIGLYEVKPVGTVATAMNDSRFRNFFEHEEDYADTYSRYSDYTHMFLEWGDYASYSNVAYFWNNDDYLYMGSGVDNTCYAGDSLGNFVYRVNSYASDTSTNFVECSNVIKVVKYDFTSEYYGLCVNPSGAYYSGFYPQTSLNLEWHDNDRYKAYPASRYCYFNYYGDKSLLFFKSFEAMFNYKNGSQNAYLSSKVEEAGEDLKLSINDMNDNIGSKIDDLIDSINNKKEGMSADELQKAIDDALASISGKLDDIGDNTQQTNNKLDALLESVSDTNQILMQILGVTTDIRDIVKTKDEEGNDYTMNDVQNCFNTMMQNVKNAILFGDNSDSSGSDSSSDLTFDSSYIMNKAELICTIGGRNFHKSNDKPAVYGVFHNSGGYWGPLLVSQDQEAVKYNTCGKEFSSNYTVQFNNKTWYVSNDEYFMPDRPSSDHIVSTEKLSPTDAALLLLQKASNSSNSKLASSYSSDIAIYSVDNLNYENGILGKFPFSVPYQLYEWLQVLQSDEKTPSFNYNYGFLIGKKSDGNYNLTFDLSEYQPWADVVKSFLRLSFTLIFAVCIYNKFKGEI